MKDLAKAFAFIFGLVMLVIGVAGLVGFLRWGRCGGKGWCELASEIDEALMAIGLLGIFLIFWGFKGIGK